MFVESCLMPQMEDVSEIIQHQVVDRFFAFSPVQTTNDKERRMTKGMTECLEKARADRPDSNILFMLDPDTLPIMSDVMLGKMQYAEKLRDNLNMSPWEVSEWLKLDVQDTPEKRDVWIKNDRLNITHPEMNAQLVPGVSSQQDQGGSSGGKNSDTKSPKATTSTGSPSTTKTEAESSSPPSLSDHSKERIKRFEKLCRPKLRRMALDALDGGGKTFALADAYAAAGGDEFGREIRVLHYRLRKAVAGAADAKRAIKDVFNEIDSRTLLAL